MTDHNKLATAEGTISNVFAHRAVIETANGAVLVDLTPKGAELITLRKGDRVTVSGEQKPSELKVFEIAKDGQAAIRIDHPRHDHKPADPKAAKQAVTAKGFKVVGEPRRKPKHFEVLVSNAAGEYLELHVELDGQVRKEKPADPNDPKWVA